MKLDSKGIASEIAKFLKEMKLLNLDTKAVVCAGAAIVLLGGRTHTSDVDMYVDSTTAELLAVMYPDKVKSIAGIKIIFYSDTIEVSGGAENLNSIIVDIDSYDINLADIETLISQKKELLNLPERNQLKKQKDLEDIAFLKSL